ncbi:S1C family serine protease [Streptomyces griseoviridis]
MNEGKPTERGATRTDGDAVGAGPDGSGGPATPAVPEPATADGDFVLRRPETPPTAETAGVRESSVTGASAGSAMASTDSSAGPASASAGPASASAGSATADTADTVTTGDTVTTADTLAASATASPAVPAAEQPAASVPAPPPPAPQAPPVASSGHSAPLHDPDPYSTPPYGQPGPWASAPPFQHPATAPRPPADPPAGVPAPAPAPVEEGAVASGTPSPAPASVPPADGADPWRNYDPWARGGASGSSGVAFQQSGEGVESTGQRRRRVRRALVGGAVVLALVSGLGGGIVGTWLERNGGLGDIVLPQAAKEPAGRDPDSVAGISARALPSVVTLHVSGSKESGTGTGFVLDDRGHILTNSHVVEPAGSSGRISVTFNSGDTARATVVGRDSGYDLAVVKVSGVRGMKPLPLGNSDNVQVGDPVVAIGAPFDLAGTVTSGIISAKERPITAGAQRQAGDVSYVDALQTDAPINPGNSGGPLLDSRARVIGINSAIRSADSGADAETGQSGSIGLGFAIPVNQAKRVAEELINNGRATHPVIGVTLDMNYSGDGARVAAHGNDGDAAVTREGPGAEAGIEPGDVITEVDGRAVHTGEELIVKTRAHRPGDRLVLTVVRDGEERTVTLVLGSSHGG